MNQNSRSIERIIPWELDPQDPVHQSILEFHYKRYDIASYYVQNKNVLDLACGVGYGSDYLFNIGKAKSVTGVDIDSEAIGIAKNQFEREGIHYECAPYQNFFRRNYFDMAVSLETIEHLPDPEDFLKHVSRMLRKNSLLVGSVPVTPSVDVNPHHLQDFSEGSMNRLLRKCGFEVQYSHRIVQAFPLSIALKALFSKSGQVEHHQLRPNVLAYYLTHPQKLALRLGATLLYGLDVHYYLFVAKKVA